MNNKYLVESTNQHGLFSQIVFAQNSEEAATRYLEYYQEKGLDLLLLGATEVRAQKLPNGRTRRFPLRAAALDGRQPPRALPPSVAPIDSGRHSDECPAESDELSIRWRRGVRSREHA